MSADDSDYTVGHGKPPLHTRFRKGQSGNPSGKPGPAKIARQRFQRALYTALDAETGALKDARPRGNLDGMARKLTLAAAGGDRLAIRFILSELDQEIARGEADPANEVAAERSDATETGDADEESGGTDEPPRMEDYALWVKAHGK